MKTLKKISCFFFIIFIANVQGQKIKKGWRNIVKNSSPEWYASDSAKEIAETVLLQQKDIGGWHKNIQMQHTLSKEEIETLKKLKSKNEGCTIDNGATTTEMLFLSKMYENTKDEIYKNAFLKGVDYLLKAQYANGGWPQFYPLRNGYYSQITYNDDAMTNVLWLFKNLMDNTEKYAITPSAETRIKIERAFSKGINCILKTQYSQNNTLTAWCAQHDVHSLLPAKARSYELPSLSGKESANIVLLLMSIENPSKTIKKAIKSAISWLDLVKLTGIKEVRTYDESRKTKNKTIVKDKNATPLWARFMELEDNTPFFSDRDGIKKSTLAEIGEERRNGYAWYTNEPSKVLKEFPKWEEKIKAQEKAKKKAENSYHKIVAKDGSGDYTTIQEAINSSKTFPYEKVIIEIKNGVYHEKVHIYSWNPHVSLIGEDKEKTIITYDDYFNKIDLGRNSTFHTPTLLVEGDNFYATNITIENTAGPVGQAVALSIHATRVMIENCKLLGHQDTLYTSGEGYKQYLKDCYIEGTTDFIFGGATALFDNCTIHSLSNSYVTAASTYKGQSYGYVFKNCNLTAANNVNKVYLGRPWRTYAKTVFIDCELDKHILPEGWNNWSNTEAETASLYAEYNNSGLGAATDKRVKWSHQLKKSQAKKYTLKNILGEGDKIEWYEKL